jgi:teichuronic acid exporter
MRGILLRLRGMLGRRHNVRAHFWQSAANYLSQIVGLAMSLVLARLLTPEQFGQFAFVAALFAILLVLIPGASGMGQILISSGARDPALFYKIRYLIYRFLIVESALGGMLALYLFISGRPVEGWLAIGLVGAHIITRPAGVYRCDLETKGEFKPIFTFTFWSVLASGIASILLAAAGAGVYSLLAGVLIGAILSRRVFMAGDSRRKIRHPLSKGEALSFLRTSIWTWIVGFASTVQSRADRVVVGGALSERDLGYYSRGINFSPLSYLLLQSFMGNAATSSYARAIDDAHRLRILAKTCALVFTGAILNFVLWFYFSDPLVPMLFGPQWTGAIPVFTAFAGLAFCFALRDIPTTFLLGQKKFRLMAGLNLISTGMFLVGIFINHESLTIVTTAYILQVSMAVPGLIALIAIGIQFVFKRFKYER